MNRRTDSIDFGARPSNAPNPPEPGGFPGVVASLVAGPVPKEDLMKSGSLVRMVWAMSFALPVGFAAAERPANACETAIREVVDTSSLNIASAERALSEGRYAAAVVGVSKAFPNIKKMNVGAG